MVMKMPLERHILNLYGCSKELLAKVGPLQQRLDPLLEEISQTSYFHQFSPEGVTGIYLWPGGHLTIHTWPQDDTAAVDLFSLDGTSFIKRVKTLFPEQYQPKQKVKLGKYVAATLENVDHKSLQNQQRTLQLLRKVSEEAEYNVVGEVSLETEQGIDAALVLAESHFSLHYQQKKAYVDIFTCGQEGNPKKGIELLLDVLKPEKFSTEYYSR